MCCVEMEQHREMEPHRCALSQTRAAAEVGMQFHDSRLR